MSFALTVLSLVIAGRALLALLRLATGSRAADLALAWLVGSGWFAAAAAVARFALGLPLSRMTAGAIVLVPIVAWGAVRGRRGARAAAAAPPAPGGDAGDPSPARWLPRPAWLFALMAAYVVVVTLAVLLHGASTPTHTDDGVRVRAFAPMLAFDDRWEVAAREIFLVAGPLPTFVPALGWILAGHVDHFHVNYAVLAELLALLLLVVGLASARGSPERGWASAFALLSIPFFVYHCTSTYSDAVLAMRIGGGVFLWLEYVRGRDRRDAAGALLLLGLATLVKREGELVAAAAAAVLVLQLVLERRRGGASPWPALAPLGGAVALEVVGKVAAVGIAAAFPMLRFVVEQSALAASAAEPLAPGIRAAAAGVFLEGALLRSGNAGMLYWVLAAAAIVRARAVVRSGLVWPGVGVALLLAEVAVSSIALVPQYTVDQSTVHRALLVVSVPAALWLAAVLSDAAADPRERG